MTSWFSGFNKQEIQTMARELNEEAAAAAAAGNTREAAEKQAAAEEYLRHVNEGRNYKPR